MNVFADLLTVLGQERFQQFLEQTPSGIFHKMHHIKIQCQLLWHLMILEKENVRDDMFVIKINGTIVKGMPQSCGIMEKQRMKMARSTKVKLLVRLLVNLVDLG